MPSPKVLPKVAPHDACYVCFRGDTQTCFAYQGNAYEHIVLRMKLGIGCIEANAVVQSQWIKAGEEGPMAVQTQTYQLCDECATRAELPRLYSIKPGTVIYPITIRDLTPGLPPEVMGESDA